MGTPSLYFFLVFIENKPSVKYKMLKVLGLTFALFFWKIIFIYGTNIGKLQICLKDLLYKLIIGNTSNAKAPENLNETWYGKRQQ